MSRQITATILTAALVTGLLFSLGLAVGCGGREEPAPEETVYTCPMHPDVTSDEPGECPICGMDLVPKEETTE